MDQIKLQKIDKFLLCEYKYLEPTDYCYFLGEYAGGLGFAHSEMNQVINNFKKPVERKNLPEWHYKEESIVKVANWLVSTTHWQKLKSITWIPMPPSKIKSDSQYDDRLWRVLLKMKKLESALDIRELLLAKDSREAAHNPGAIRPKPHDHINNFILDTPQKNATPNGIIIFDDIITSGAHFKAAQTILQKEFSNVPILGIFIARNVLRNSFTL